MKIMKGGGKDQVCVMAIKKMDWPLDLMVTPPVLPIRKPYDCRRDKNNNTSKSVGENVEEHTLVITMKIMTGNGTCIGDWDEDFEKYLPVMFIWAPLASLFAWMSAMSSGNRPLRETPDKK